jgi:hypothetical protein
MTADDTVPQGIEVPGWGEAHDGEGLIVDEPITVVTANSFWRICPDAGSVLGGTYFRMPKTESDRPPTPSINRRIRDGAELPFVRLEWIVEEGELKLNLFTGILPLGQERGIITSPVVRVTR